MAYCPDGVNQPRTQKKRIAWEMEKSWVKTNRKAVFLDQMPLKNGEIITKDSRQGTSLLRPVVPSSGHNMSLLKTSQVSKENSKFSHMQPKKVKTMAMQSQKVKTSAKTNNYANKSKDIRLARFKKNLKMVNKRQMLKFTHSYSEGSTTLTSTSSSSSSSSSDSTDSNQPIPIHFKLRDIEFTKITFTDELEKEKKKLEKVKNKLKLEKNQLEQEKDKLDQEKIKMEKIREEQIKAHQESTATYEKSQFQNRESQYHLLEAGQSFGSQQLSDIMNPKINQTNSHQAYMFEYLAMMDQRMVALSRSTYTVAQGLDELNEEPSYQSTNPRMKQNQPTSTHRFLCSIPLKSLSPNLVRDLIAKSNSRVHY